MWLQIPMNLKEQVTGKTREQIEAEERQKSKEKQIKWDLETLIRKYWDMMKLYEQFSYKNSKWEYDSKFFKELPHKIVIEKFQNTKLTSTKLRQYYDMINSLYHARVWWETLKRELYMILAKANYDLNRKEIVPKNFVDFLRINIDMVFDQTEAWKVSENFMVFKKHFEAVVAYAKWVLSDK